MGLVIHLSWKSSSNSGSIRGKNFDFETERLFVFFLLVLGASRGAYVGAETTFPLPLSFFRGCGLGVTLGIGIFLDSSLVFEAIVWGFFRRFWRRRILVGDINRRLFWSSISVVCFIFRIRNFVCCRVDTLSFSDSNSSPNPIWSSNTNQLRRFCLLWFQLRESLEMRSGLSDDWWRSLKQGFRNHV